MEGEFSALRRSQRLLGIPPENCIIPLPGIRQEQEGAKTTAAETGKNSLIQFSRATSVTTEKSHRRSNRSVCSSQSEATRRKLKAEIDSMQRIGKAEEEFLLAKQRLETEKKIEEKRLEMEKIQIDEGLEDDVDEDVRQLDIPEASRLNEEENVQRWLKGNDERSRQAIVDPYAEAAIHQVVSTNERLDKLLSRQVVCKDLPQFHGNPEEWPMFLSQYRRTTEMCGLSEDENVIRLEKCLKGKARDSVLPILGLPENVERVIDTLSLLFGRSDQIIKAMIMKVKAATSPATNKPEAVILYSNLVANLVATIKNLGRTGHLYNPQLLEELVLKLSYHQQFKWCSYVKRLAVEPSLVNLQDWLAEEALTASMMPSNMLGNEEKVKPEQKGKEKKVLFAAVNKVEKGCYHCTKEGHGLVSCKLFEDAAIQTRWKTVKTHNLCYSCLAKGHKGMDCKKKTVCGIDGCERHHHKLLHKTDKAEVPKEEFVGHVDLSMVMKEVLLRILPVKINGPRGSMDTYALLDEGSTVTLLESSLAVELGLDGPQESLHIQWTNDVSREEITSKRVSLEISGSHSGAKRFRLENARTIQDLSLTTQSVDMNILRKHWPYLKDVPFQSLLNAQPMLLIGSDNILLTTPRQLRQGHWNDPVATKTWLGWVVHGNLPLNRRVNVGQVHNCTALSPEMQLMRMLKESFSTENFGVRVVHEHTRSKEDERALSIMQTTTKRDGMHFQTGLLWRSEKVMLPESRTMALRRLQCMERKMDQDPIFAEKYSEKIEDYLKKGYCRKLTRVEAGMKSTRTYYLPHFATFNPQKPEKLRLVFDAASKSHGVSLNDALLKGPDLLNPLPAVLWRFRRHAIGIAGDIQEMFHQVKIRSEDQDSQRFLWRGKRRVGEPDEYVMQVMIFGAACSPSSAIYVTQQNAEDQVSDFPEASISAKRNCYVDDYTHGADDEEGALQELQHCVELFKRGGFRMCNWACSSKSVIQMVPPELRAKNWVDLTNAIEMPTERVLGLRWDPEKDEFNFAIKFPKVNNDVLELKRTPTKAEVTSLVMSPYDPVGFLTHFIIKGRMLIQEIWLKKVDWKEQISGDLEEKWKLWVTELKHITNVRVPRCYAPGRGLKGAKLSLQVFCDASEKAFATVVYMRIEQTGEVSVAFVAARARVAPLKALSIPRLELQAALMGSRLAKAIKEEIDLPITEIQFWSDSRTVLWWIRDDSRKYLAFVAHRVGEILETTEATQWRWVPTKENPADEATRNDGESDFNPDSRWLNGPEFLKRPKAEWPTEKESQLEGLGQLELKKEYVHTTKVVLAMKEVFLAHNFSSWLKLVRVTAWVIRYVKNCKCKRSGATFMKGELTGEELRFAQVYWWKNVQGRNFAGEIQALQTGKTLSPCSRLWSLTPSLDAEGVLRMQGRIGNARELSFGTKWPVILEPEHPYTRLLVKHLHRESNHQGVETVLSNLRLNYWVIKGRAAVKKAFSECQWCKVWRARPKPPLMGPLPEVRLSRQQRPFSNTGLDFFGPLLVTANRKTVKRYGAIFTCLSTRAIHLEVANDLSTDSAINALRRFMARRGCPEKLLSDNGTNFHGAANELKKALKEIDKDELTRTFAGKGVTWIFNPPSSPHIGGVWERMVKSVKIALQVTLRGAVVKEDVLHTLFCEAEFIVNNRPLTHVSVDPDDPECLTPNHFLMCGSVLGNIPGMFSDEDLNRRSQWKIVQRYSDLLWSRWLKEYLPTLARRTKWFQRTTPLQVGDVVVVADKDGPRNSWPLGRIVRIYPGRDGQVRFVDVKTKDGVYQRPVVKICVLDVSRGDEETQSTSGGRNVAAESNCKSKEKRE